LTEVKKQAKWVRYFRWLHRKVSLAFFIFILIMTITGILLGLKKPTGLLAPTQKGVSTELSIWLPVHTLQQKAERYLHDSISKELSVELDRVDIRPDKGIVKFIYKHHYHGLQLDGVTGDLLSIETRSSDFIEALHDGSILDDLTGTGGEQFKVSYSVLVGVSLLLLILSGLWLWYGPRRIRKMKRTQIENKAG